MKKLYRMLQKCLVTSIYRFRHWLVCEIQNMLFLKSALPNKICVHRVGAFGDSIVAIPALSAIRKNFPLSQIDLISTQVLGVSLLDIAEKDTIADNIFIYKKGERKKAWELIRANKYDLYIEIPQNLNLIKTFLGMFRVRFLFGIRSAFGWDKGRIKSFANIQNQYMPFPRESDRFLKILAAHGVFGEERYELKISKEDHAYAEALVTDHGRGIAFILGGKLPLKKWPLSYWKKLARELEKNHRIYLIGGENEKSEAHLLAHELSNCVNLCGKTSLMQTAAILERLRFAISHDTGAMHLAYAVNLPVIALFSTRDFTSKWHPPKNLGIVLESYEPCSFCFKSVCENNVCMQHISVSAVMNAVQKLLETHKESDKNESTNSEKTLACST